MNGGLFPAFCKNIYSKPLAVLSAVSLYWIWAALRSFESLDPEPSPGTVSFAGSSPWPHPTCEPCASTALPARKSGAVLPNAAICSSQCQVIHVRAGKSPGPGLRVGAHSGGGLRQLH